MTTRRILCSVGRPRYLFSPATVAEVVARAVERILEVPAEVDDRVPAQGRRPVIVVLIHNRGSPVFPLQEVPHLAGEAFAHGRAVEDHFDLADAVQEAPQVIRETSINHRRTAPVQDDRAEKAVLGQVQAVGAVARPGGRVAQEFGLPVHVDLLSSVSDRVLSWAIARKESYTSGWMPRFRAQCRCTAVAAATERCRRSAMVAPLICRAALLAASPAVKMSGSCLL